MPGTFFTDSTKGVYQILGSYEWPVVKTPGANEFVHRSVVERLNNSAMKYHPRNAEEFARAPTIVIVPPA